MPTRVNVCEDSLGDVTLSGGNEQGGALSDSGEWTSREQRRAFCSLARTAAVLLAACVALGAAAGATATHIAGLMANVATGCAAVAGTVGYFGRGRIRR